MYGIPDKFSNNLTGFRFAAKRGGGSMLVPLAAVKQYLRIDGDEEDDLLTHFAETAEQICTALLRVKKLSKVEDQAIVRVAILYAVSYLYEHREEADHRGLALTLRSLLFGVRKEVF